MMSISTLAHAFVIILAGLSAYGLETVQVAGVRDATAMMSAYKGLECYRETKREYPQTLDELFELLPEYVPLLGGRLRYVRDDARGFVLTARGGDREFGTPDDKKEDLRSLARKMGSRYSGLQEPTESSPPVWDRGKARSMTGAAIRAKMTLALTKFYRDYGAYPKDLDDLCKKTPAINDLPKEVEVRLRRRGYEVVLPVLGSLVQYNRVNEDSCEFRTAARDGVLGTADDHVVHSSTFPRLPSERGEDSQINKSIKETSMFDDNYVFGFVFAFLRSRLHVWAEAYYEKYDRPPDDLSSLLAWHQEQQLFSEISRSLRNKGHSVKLPPLGKLVRFESIKLSNYQIRTAGVDGVLETSDDQIRTRDELKQRRRESKTRRQSNNPP